MTIPPTSDAPITAEAQADLIKHRTAAEQMATIKARFEFRPAEIEALLERHQRSLAEFLVDRETGINRSAEIHELRQKISNMRLEKEEIEYCVQECEKRRLRAGYAAGKARRVLDDLRDYDAAKYALTDEKYTGSTGAMQASRRLDELATRLGLSDDLANFYIWLREVKPAVFWEPRDRRGLDGAS